MAGAFLAWVNNLSLSQLIRTSPGLFLPLRFLHFVSVMFVLVSISKVDLRLMGAAHKRTPVTELIAEIIPWTLWSFAVAATTGLLLFVSKAPSFYGNTAFRLKILFIGLALINAALFHRFTYRGVALWDEIAPTTFPAKVAGALSLSFWLAAAVFGVQTVFTVGN